jgi:hypothetical protein
MLSTAEEYLQRAQEYRRLASEARDPAIETYLLVLAEEYEEEAKSLAHPSAPTSSHR